MPSQTLTTTENNFTKGLVTEYTGLNFPENACTAADNSEFTLIGDVVRRYGIDFESGYSTLSSTGDSGRNTFVWTNVGGDGVTKFLVRQQGSTLYFYDITTSTTTTPLSTQLLSSTITISNFVAVGATFDATQECQFAAGNGYLFVYNPTCDPFYCTYSNGTITGNVIYLQIRDEVGVVDSLQGQNVSTRPSVLSTDHQYNLQNQGWTSGADYSTTSTNSISIPSLGNYTFQVSSGLSAANGDSVSGWQYASIIPGLPPQWLAYFSGTVTGYSGTTMTINVFAYDYFTPADQFPTGPWVITENGQGYIQTWQSDEGNYPSNADVWWYFKTSTGTFDPSSTAGSVTLASGNAPQGHYILSAFNQNRALASGIPGITPVTTTARPTNGAWFQGRVFYTGVNASQGATGDASFYTWTENIYYSPTVTDVSDFETCYQTNDPTSETLFGELPTDGGVFPVVGAGQIYKLWPIMNGMLIFAANGVWFLTGSQGIGFSSNDFTITKISAVQSISSTSFVDVLGLPYFWNQEGIYQVMPSQSGSLTVEPITVGTILTFFNNIPFASKKYVRGDYHPINYVIQWTYRSTTETGIGDRYHFDSILNYNVYNKAFFPYSLSNTGVTGSPYINGVVYISYPQIDSNTPDPDFKYPCNFTLNNTFTLTFAEEYNTTFTDWVALGGINYVSTFTTGYKVHGQGLTKFQIPYVNVFTRNIADYMAYYIQGLWDYPTSSDAGTTSSNQFIEMFDVTHGYVIKRHRIRGRGYALQLQFTSVAGQPFDFVGWSILESRNTGV